jgi:hypothetical protein
MKFGIDIMPLDTTLKSYFSISYSFIQLLSVDARTCKVGVTLPPLNIGSYNDVW